MRKEPKVRHLRDVNLDDKFGIKSYFEVEGHRVEVSTEYWALCQGMDHIEHPYSVGVYLRTPGNREEIERCSCLYRTQEETEAAHWELVEKIKRGDKEFLDELYKAVESLRKAA